MAWRGVSVISIWPANVSRRGVALKAHRLIWPVGGAWRLFWQLRGRTILPAAGWLPLTLGGGAYIGGDFRRTISRRAWRRIMLAAPPARSSSGLAVLHIPAGGCAIRRTTVPGCIRDACVSVFVLSFATTLL